MGGGGVRVRALVAVVAVLVAAACGQKAGVGGPDQPGTPFAAGAPTTVTTGGAPGEIPAATDAAAAGAADGSPSGQPVPGPSSSSRASPSPSAGRPPTSVTPGSGAPL
ncbi:MAG TPA: hypothetical protein VFS16_13805, partial [Acidimicrobiia bacterium]|nr:hypothetical protein [Acidimicrobiia bacterium]